MSASQPLAAHIVLSPDRAQALKASRKRDRAPTISSTSSKDGKHVDQPSTKPSVPSRSSTSSKYPHHFSLTLPTYDANRTRSQTQEGIGRPDRACSRGPFCVLVPPVCHRRRDRLPGLTPSLVRACSLPPSRLLFILFHIRSSQHNIPPSHPSLASPLTLGDLLFIPLYLPCMYYTVPCHHQSHLPFVVKMHRPRATRTPHSNETPPKHDRVNYIDYDTAHHSHLLAHPSSLTPVRVHSSNLFNSISYSTES